MTVIATIDWNATEDAAEPPTTPFVACVLPMRHGRRLQSWEKLKQDVGGRAANHSI
jgi:hypothetical protein